MDEIPAIQTILLVCLRWRIWLSAGVAAYFAVNFSQVYADFTAGYCCLLTVLGLGFGLFWQMRAEAGLNMFAPIELSVAPVSNITTFFSL